MYYVIVRGFICRMDDFALNIKLSLLMLSSVVNKMALQHDGLIAKIGGRL